MRNALVAVLAIASVTADACWSLSRPSRKGGLSSRASARDLGGGVGAKMMVKRLVQWRHRPRNSSLVSAARFISLERCVSCPRRSSGSLRQARPTRERSLGAASRRLPHVAQDTLPMWPRTLCLCGTDTSVCAVFQPWSRPASGLKSVQPDATRRRGLQS